MQNQNTCQEGIDFFCSQKETDLIKLMKKYKSVHPKWCNWFIVRCMTYKQYVSYAVFAAEQVINIFEKKYPEDKRPRIAIEKAKICINNPTKENKKNAAAVSAAAYDTAAYSASATVYSASAAVYSASAAAYDTAAYSAAAAYVAAAKKEMQIKILNYGIKLLKS